MIYTINYMIKNKILILYCRNYKLSIHIYNNTKHGLCNIIIYIIISYYIIIYIII